MKYSIIILVDELDPGLPPFIETLKDVLTWRKESYEIVIVANGAGRETQRQIEGLLGEHEDLKVYELARKAPRATALRAGFEESTGEIIMVCGSHQQISRESLVELMGSLDGSTDVVNSWRADRTDSSFNQWQSRIYNGLVRAVTGSSLHDLSSAIKLFRRQVLEEVEIYGNLYRFLPVLAAQKGFRVKEVRCTHHEWRGKTGLVGLGEYVERFVDIFTLYFITRFARKPLRFFSLFGLGFFVTGLAIASTIFVQKILFGHGIGERPIFLVGMFLLVLGVQVASTGLLGEIVAFTHGRRKPQYNIEKVI